MFLEGSVFQHLYPLDKWRKSLRSDHRELAKAAELWSNASGEILFLAASHPDEFNFQSVPVGYEELTLALAWWCDVGPYSIDPAPLCETLRLAEAIAGGSRVAVGDSGVEVEEDLRADVERFGDAYVQSSSILDRMLYAAFEEAGEESPKLKKIKKYKPQQGTLEVIALIRQGLDNDAIHERTFNDFPAIDQIRSRLRLDRYDLKT